MHGKILAGLLIVLSMTAQNAPPAVDPALAEVRTRIRAARLTGDWVKTESLLNEAIDVAGRAAGNNSVEVADLLVELAAARRALGQYAGAIASLDRSVRMRLQYAPTDGPPVARALTMLGLLYLEDKNAPEARGRLMHALTVWKQAEREDPEVLPALEALAGLYREEADYTAAEPLYLRAFRIREIAFGPGSAEMIPALDSLAYVYFGQKRYAEAEPLYIRLLALWETSAGPDHPMVAFTLDKMAQFYAAQQMFAGAECLSDRSLQIRAKVYIGGLWSRGQIAAMQGDKKTGEEYAKKIAAMIDLAGLPKPEVKMVPPPKSKPKPKSLTDSK